MHQYCYTYRRVGPYTFDRTGHQELEGKTRRSLRESGKQHISASHKSQRAMEVLRKEVSGPVAANRAKNSAVGMRMLVERFDIGRRLIQVVETTVKFIVHFAHPFILEVPWGKVRRLYNYYHIFRPPLTGGMLMIKCLGGCLKFGLQQPRNISHCD